MSFAWTVPQLLALLLLAVIAAAIAELIVGNAPMFGFVGAILLSFLGVWIFVNLSWFPVAFEPRFEDLPVIRAVLGGVVISGLFAFAQKKRSV